MMHGQNHIKFENELLKLEIANKAGSLHR